jgi:hypothetical protein
VIISRKMRWARHVSDFGAVRNAYKVWKGRESLQDPGLDWRTILVCVLTHSLLCFPVGKFKCPVPAIFNVGMSSYVIRSKPKYLRNYLK